MKSQAKNQPKDCLLADVRAYLRNNLILETAASLIMTRDPRLQPAARYFRREFVVRYVDRDGHVIPRKDIVSAKMRKDGHLSRRSLRFEEHRFLEQQGGRS